MGRIGISFEDVALVADELVLLGIEPSTVGIRERLGKGSNSTIGVHLAKWRDKKGLARRPSIALTLPSDVAAAVADHIQAQCDALERAFEATLAAERAANQQSEENLERLTTELETSTAHVVRLEAEVAEFAGRLKQSEALLKEEALEWQKKWGAAEQRASEAEKIAAVAAAHLEAAERRANEAASRETDIRQELKSKTRDKTGA